ncbi:MAG: DUF2207 family protein, partial [Actinomycetes bacterium]
PSEWPGRALAVALAAAAVAATVAVRRRTRERTPGMPVLFEPPDHIIPVLGVRVVDEDDSDADLQATLFDLAARGVVQISRDDDRSWTVSRVGDPDPQSTHPADTEVLQALFLDRAGDVFTVSNSKLAGERITAARKALRRAIDAESATYLTPSGAGAAARVLGWGATIAVVAQVGIYHFGGQAWSNLPLLVGTTVLSVGLLGIALDPRTRTVHTDAGRELWSRAGGFARFLSTESSETRFDAAAHRDWFQRYLPWAVALGVGSEWARRYAAQGVELGSDAVPWLYWYGGPARWSDTSMTDSFNAAISTASATYAASQVSAAGSAFSGGFSGGSGLGGGGGGSW